MTKYNDILQSFSTAPDSQIAKSITPRLLALSKKEVIKSDELLDIIDDCVFGSLASDFAVAAMNIVWIELLNDEGKTVDQALIEAKTRRDNKKKH